MSLFDPENHFLWVEAYYSMRFDRYEMAIHRHARCEIMYTLRGKCTIRIDSQQLEMKEGHFIFIDQSVPHSLYIQKDAPCSVLNLEFTCRPSGEGIDLRDLLTHMGIVHDFLVVAHPYLLLFDSGVMCHALKDLITELERGASAEKNDVLRLLLTRMMIELSRCAASQGNAASFCYVRKAQVYIHARLDTDMLVQDIASHVGIHKTYLQKLFRQYVHCSITQYRNRLRLQKAAYLLRNTTASVTEIAFCTGYNSRQHFARMFEQFYAASPVLYRRQNGLAQEVDTQMMKSRISE